ncbi:hypothetical protein NPIL_510451 [Nephila pilipes]|uniref:Uncharacterized protein n=1 Tax=Nephila pilipes TaxID=299642 RepID=A0A8X6QDX6_NEPPI|nr:hypothetical protein NPIL_510451 [Nephila pilipes]
MGSRCEWILFAQELQGWSANEQCRQMGGCRTASCSRRNDLILKGQLVSHARGGNCPTKFVSGHELRNSYNNPILDVNVHLEAGLSWTLALVCQGCLPLDPLRKQSQRLANGGIIQIGRRGDFSHLNALIRCLGAIHQPTHPGTKFWIMYAENLNSFASKRFS